MIIKWNYKKNQGQQSFHEDIESNFLHFSAGFGSGKSYALVMKMMQLSWLNKGYPGGFMVTDYTDFMRDIYPMVEEICDKHRISYHYHKTHHWYQFPWSKGKVYVVTAEKKVRGPNWAFGLVNELTLIPFERFRDFIGRVRVKGAKAAQIATCGTPEGVLSGYYDFFIDRKTDNVKVVYGNTMDNEENLSPAYIESLKLAYDSKTLEAYMAGKFINMTGNQFYYAYRPEVNEDLSIRQLDNHSVHVFMDFNVQRMTATVWNLIQEENGQQFLRGFDEIVIPDNADTKLMCQALITRGYTPDITYIYPDPAGKARSTKGQPDTEIIKQAGFYNVRVRSAAPPMRRRQLNVCNLLEKGKIKYNPKVMPTMRKDFLLVEQDKVTLEKVKKNEELTHASDGLDYGCDILFPFSGYKPDSKVFKLR